MSWNPQPALGGALWQGNQTLATVRQLNSTTQSLISSIEALSTTGDYQFDILKTSTLFVSTITSIDGKSALRITNLSSIRISTFGNYLQDSDNIQTTAKTNHYNFLNGTYTNRNFDTVNNLYDPLTNKTDILTGTGSFQALTGAMTIAATNSTLNLYAGDVINMTGKVNANSNDFTNIKGLSSISVSTGTLIAGAATLNGNLDMNGNSISAANVITTNTLSASLVGATSGNFTNISGSLQGNVTGNIYNQNLTVGAKYSINETVDVGSAVSDYGSYGTLNLNAKGGLGGIVNITADVATPINPAVTVSQLTAEAKGNYGLITPGTPVGYIPRGGLVSIIARQGLTPSPPAEVTSALFANGEIDLTAYSYGTVPGLIKMSAGANFMYAGTITPLTGIYGNNYIYGQYANSITAGLPSGGLPNTPGTNYIYGYNGTIVENGLYVDTVYNKFGGDLSLNARTSNLNLNGATVQAQTNVVGQGHGLFDFANITGVNYDISINASGGHVVNLSNVNNFFGSNIRVSSLSTFNLLASNAFINYMQIQNLSTNNMVVSTVTTGDITGLPGTATATTVSFTYTGANQTWTAPAGCYYIDITLNGACGGNFSGLGGKVSGRLNVNPGQVYTIIVGAGGQNTTPGPATYGGGGAGNYSGGGRTAIAYAGADLATAGGGGGNPYYSGFTGGNGGGLTGAAGTGTGADGGLGGSQTAGGSGGVDSNPGGNGSQYQGGTGSGYGGGGGGGYFGGGGGADSGNPPAFLSGGGGGGSSYVANLYYNVVNTQGGGATTGRNGTASITYYVGNDTVLTLDAQQTNITGNAFIDGDVTGVNTLTATAVTTNTIQSLNPITISSPSLVLSCTPSTTGAFTVNGRGMRNFEFGISQTWSANQLNGVKTVTDANGARYHPSQWVMNHALLGVYEFAGINTASALNYIQTFATTDTNGYLALQWQIFANVDRSGNNGVIKWNLTMIPLEMTQALAPNQVSAGAVVPVALSTVLYTYPNTFASTIIASTLSIKASENLALIANLPYPTFLGVGTVAINANTNVDLMANVDITLGAAHDINATATSHINLTSPAIKLDGAVEVRGNLDMSNHNITNLGYVTGVNRNALVFGSGFSRLTSESNLGIESVTGYVEVSANAGAGAIYLTANNIEARGYLNMNSHPIYMGNATIYNANELYNNNTDLLLTGVGRNIRLTAPSIQLNGATTMYNDLLMNNHNINNIYQLNFSNSTNIDGAYPNQMNFNASNSYFIGNLRLYGTSLLDMAGNNIYNCARLEGASGFLTVYASAAMTIENGLGCRQALNTDGSFELKTTGANQTIYLNTQNVYFTGGSNNRITDLGHIYGNTASPGGGLAIDYMYGLFFNSAGNNANLYASGGNLNMTNYNAGTYIYNFNAPGTGNLSLYSASNDVILATGTGHNIAINSGSNIYFNAAQPNGLLASYASTINSYSLLDTNITTLQNFNVNITGSAQLHASYFNFFNDCYFNNTTLHDIQNIYFGYGPYINRNIPGGYTNAFLDIIGAGGDGQLRLINGSSEVALRANSDLGITPTSGHNIVLNGPISASSNLNMNYHDITNLSYVSGSNIVIQDLGGNLDLLSYRVALPSGFLDLPATNSKIDFNGYCYISRDYGTSNFNINASRNLSILTSSVTRNLGATEVVQPVIQYGTATASGSSGSVSVTLPQAYTSATSYIVTASMMDVDAARISVNRNSSSNITIYWAQAGSGTQTLGWQTSGN